MSASVLSLPRAEPLKCRPLYFVLIDTGTVTFTFLYRSPLSQITVLLILCPYSGCVSPVLPGTTRHGVPPSTSVVPGSPQTPSTTSPPLVA